MTDNIENKFSYIEEKKQIYLSSSSSRCVKLNNGKNSQIKFFLDKLLSYDMNIIKYATIKLVHCEIPYSFYIVNEYNNELIINDTSYFIPLGNYNAQTFLEYINQIIPQQFILNSVNGKFTIEHTTSFTINSSNINKLIGNNDINKTSILNSTTNKYIIELPNLCDFSGTKNIYIRLPNIKLNNIDGVNSNSNIFKSISCRAIPYNILFYNNIENSENLLSKEDINYIEVDILDDDNNFINFNSLDWSMCIEIKTLSKVQDFEIPEQFK